MAEIARFFDGKKFMWDGKEYDSEEQAGSAEQEYRTQGFEVQAVHEAGKVALYTRRVVTEVVVQQN